MDPGPLELLFVLLGVAIGAASALAWRLSERELRGPSAGSTPETPVLPPGVANVLSVIRSSAVVVDDQDRVLQASAPAYSLGLVRTGELRLPEVVELVHTVRRDGQIRQTELVIEQGGGRPPLYVEARVAPLNSRVTLVLADDRTHEKRVEAIRRDFVANVSHELKTPVGALTLLAEAVGEASEDPEAVRRFAARMRTEASRLNYLVQQIIELSRLQGDQAVTHPEPVDLDAIIERAIDATAIEAEVRGIDVVYDGQRGHLVRGSPGQVSLALMNLVSNAVAYSPDHSRVVVSALPDGTMVDLNVTDRGIGIPVRELDRIFERFYRVDPARHRSTGGTGLGLSIVKHVAASHGGEVLVWSTEGEGSSFTLRLPRLLTPVTARPQTPTRTPTQTPTQIPSPSALSTYDVAAHEPTEEMA